MNKERRKELASVADMVSGIKSELSDLNIESMVSTLNEAKEAVDKVKDEEQEAFDNLSENLQTGDRGQRMEEIINELDTASSDIGDLVDKLGTLQEIEGDIEGIEEKLTSAGEE